MSAFRPTKFGLLTRRFTTRFSHATLQVPLLCAAGICFVASFGYDGPPPGDPSAWTDLVIGEDPHDGPEHMYEGTFEGGLTGTDADASANNSRDDLDAGGGSFNIPSGGPPSHLYGVQSFSQQLLRFEELGTQPMETSYGPQPPFPSPPTAQTMPDGDSLDTFLDQPMAPEPTWHANTDDQNPWMPEIEAYLGYTLGTAPAEGRPPGEGWAHQRSDEFAAVRYFQSVTTGARVNRGLRDNAQAHGYNLGEFGPTGLYHNTAGVPITAGTTTGINIAFHPAMPIQDPQALWTFDGTLPPKLLMARIGEPLLFRHYNGLPIDIAANRGFGAHTITTHEHNGHNPAESDGYFNAFFFPGQFYDYRWPMVLAGHDSCNTDASDPRAGYPDGNGGITNIRGDFREVMSTHWFHDHMQDYTAQNVYKGNVAMMNYYSSIDRGNEEINDGINLRFPSGAAQDWGNRDYDVNLVIADKAWDEEGQLWYNPFQNDGFLGDHVLTNWLYHPYMEVRARKYRLRLLNGCVARYFKFALVQEVQGSGGQMPGPEGSGVSYNPVSSHMIANDGNIMAHSIPMDGTTGLLEGELPIQGIGERFDIIVDFSAFAPGDKVYLVNLLEHKSGRRPEDSIDLEEVLSEEYKGWAEDTDGDGVLDRYKDGDPCVGRFLELQVRAMEPGQVDLSMDPAAYEPGGLVMVELPIVTPGEIQNARRREFRLGRSQGSDDKPWTIRNIDGSFNADSRRITAAPVIGDLEIWTFRNTSGGWSHPMHIHFEESRVLSHDGQAPPLWEIYARKDIFRIGPEEHSGDEIEVMVRFREFNGTFVEHCHNTTHEDTAMLKRWDLEFPGQVKLMPAPLPTWSGVEYVDSFALEHARVGDGGSFGRGPRGAILAGNQAPVAVADSGRTTIGQPLVIEVLANDTDADGDLDPGGVVITQAAANGSLEVLTSGSVRYITSLTSNGLDHFRYTVSDAAGHVSNPVTVSISIQ